LRKRSTYCHAYTCKTIIFPVLASVALDLSSELLRIRERMAPCRSAPTSTSITHWHHFQEKILLGCISANGIWQSKTGPQQMESAASKWENVFLYKVTEANPVQKAFMEAFKRVFEQDLASWEATGSGSCRERRQPKYKAVKEVFSIRVLQDKRDQCSSRYKNPFSRTHKIQVPNTWGKWRWTKCQLCQQGAMWPLPVRIGPCFRSPITIL
jgi:hypothetical protein